MGSATGGPGGHAPAQQKVLGASNAFGHPKFRENSVMYTINVQYSVFL